jgi:small subunit ribosomal protein S8
MINDSVGDVLIRIKNGYMASRSEVSAPYSKLVMNICELLLKSGYIEKAQQKDNVITITLKYEGRAGAVSDVKRVSKPGLRVYKGAKALPRVLNGLGIAIISTPKGLMTDREARKAGLGGEVMAYVW